MNWIQKAAQSDKDRFERNIRRLEALRAKVHDLGYFVLSSQSGGYQFLKDLMDENIVRGRPKIKAKMQEALIGENNQKLALDNPNRVKEIMRDVEDIIDREIMSEKRQLKELGS